MSEEKRLTINEWRPWFAWRPVINCDGALCWLEPMERRYIDGRWVYRDAPDNVLKDISQEILDAMNFCVIVAVAATVSVTICFAIIIWGVR